MTSLRNTLAALLVAGAALTAMPAMTGCFGTEEAYIVADTPPPPREEVVVARSGFIWVHGRWAHLGNRWVWRGGYYERERPNQIYVEGHWEPRGRGHIWVQGGWRTRSGVAVRDHR